MFTLHLLGVFFFSTSTIIYGRRFPDDGYYSADFFNSQQAQNSKVKTALEKLDHSPQWVIDWPTSKVNFGQVSGVTLDSSGLLWVFHRATNTWDENTFTDRNVYQAIGEPPISHPTIMVFNDTGDVVDMWGQNLFYMPHGITVDHDGNVWVTDVALHQVFKFTPNQKEKPVLVLGEKFIPGDDDEHFCKPSAVAVLSNGDFFVSDGYCNTRIVKFAADGTKILQWGRRMGESPFVFNVPHALTLAEEHNALCAADRERGRVACFRTDNCTFIASYSSWLMGRRIFSVAYSPVYGGRLYVVNGPELSRGVPVRGYVLEFPSGKLLQTFAPDGGFHNPHDVAVSADGSRIFVAELNPHAVHKFVDDSAVNDTHLQIKVDNTLPVKPTATVELLRGEGVSVEAGNISAGGEWWRSAAGGAAGAGGAALLLVAALALVKARNRGKEIEAEPFVK